LASPHTSHKRRVAAASATILTGDLASLAAVSEMATSNKPSPNEETAVAATSHRTRLDRSRLAVIGSRNDRTTDAFLDNADEYSMYDDAVEVLIELGFRQNTYVRMSHRRVDGLLQEDADFGGIPLLGLGARSRSYSPRLHYRTDVTVRSSSTNAIIDGFVEHQHERTETPQIGFVINPEEARRCYCILNLSLGRYDRGAYERELG